MSPPVITKKKPTVGIQKIMRKESKSNNTENHQNRE